MAVIKNNFMTISGKMGDHVYYEYKGLPCVRSNPQKVQPPSSPGQLAQQEKMAAVAIFYQALKEVGIYAYWKKAAEGLLLTGHNLLVKANLPAFDGEGNICDFAKLRLTPDTLAAPDNLSLQAGEDGKLIARWSNAVPHPRTQPEDRLVVALMKGDVENYNVKLPDIGDFHRQDEEAIFQIPDKLKRYEKIFMFFINEQACQCSSAQLFHFKNL
ncbi:DUF6266 family protein [Odoribacter lunatus]|uniref:DUF6266 family protein n=1 Tax=Odoribacter lunatus TaxID=2941335 RepID=UPI00203FCF90|nr:DUF6266 family protein [Odoribacter lunatus]